MSNYDRWEDQFVARHRKRRFFDASVKFGVGLMFVGLGLAFVGTTLIELWKTC